MKQKLLTAAEAKEMSECGALNSILSDIKSTSTKGHKSLELFYIVDGVIYCRAYTYRDTQLVMLKMLGFKVEEHLKVECHFFKRDTVTTFHTIHW